MNAQYINPTSMTFWTGFSLIGFGIFTLVQGDVEGGVQKILEGAGLIFLRRAISANGLAPFAK